MSSDANHSTESRCRFMKEQLLALGYEYGFPNDALPLLENLIPDLLQTTDTLKHYKELSESSLQACHDLEIFIDAYKKDNAWLVQELNSQHLKALSEKTAYEKRISELENHVCGSKEDIQSESKVSKSRSTSCLKAEKKTAYSVSKSEVTGLVRECKNLKEAVKNKDVEIKNLYAEILRLNDLLSGGRPIETVLQNQRHDCHSDELQIVQLKNEVLKKQLDDAIIGQHEAKSNAVKLAECYHHRQSSTSNVCYNVKEMQGTSKINQETLQKIEEELNSLKLKYQKLEAHSKCDERINLESQQSKLHEEILSLKNKCENLEQDKVRLSDELQELKTIYESSKSLNLKLEKEILQLKRLQQEAQAEKSETDKLFKKSQEEKNHLLNRINELNIIERDLSLEITRLCNINSIHKRHILELENKLLAVYQNKGQAYLSMLKPDISKKPLEKRNTKNKNKENVQVFDNASKNNIDDSNNVLTQIREKYKKQIENVQIDQNCRNVNIIELQTNLQSTNSQCNTVSLIDDIKILNKKVDNLKCILTEKEQVLSNLIAENTKLHTVISESNMQNSTKEKVHDCEHCTLAEKMITEYKEKLIVLEAEKRDLILRHNQCQKVHNCNKQHIMQLRNELHTIQIELQQHKTDSTRLNRLEEETNYTVESSRAVQKQLEIQLESTQKHLQLMEKEMSCIKSESLSLRDANLKLKKTVAELESLKDRLTASLEEKTKKIHSLDRLLKSKEQKILNLEQLVDEQQKEIRSRLLKTESKRSESNLEYLRTQVRSLEKARDEAIADNKRLQKELNILTQDYTVCKTELKKAKKQTEDLNQQVHDYIAKVQSAEEMLQQRSRERSEMLDHFRTLTVEATQLESNNQTLESEAQSTKSLLRNAETKIIDLEHIVQNKDALIAGYEQQLNELTKNIASLEIRVANLTDQRDRLQAELDSYELMCNKKHTQHESCSAVNSSNKTLDEKLHRLQSENEQLQRYLSKEKINVFTLEQILSDTRSEQSGHKSVSEMQEEISGLKANIRCLQESLEVTNKQLRKTQSEAADYQRQVVHLNRELKNVQFDSLHKTSDCDIK